jgi:bacterioferritin-associated ferredoxin
MIVCQCRRITDRDVRAAVERGARDLAGLARECGAGTDCRGCRPTLEALLADRRLVVPPASDPRRLEVVAA